MSINGIRIIITDRERLNTARLGAALIWAAIQVNHDSIRFQQKGFNQLFGVAGGARGVSAAARIRIR